MICLAVKVTCQIGNCQNNDPCGCPNGAADQYEVVAGAQVWVIGPGGLSWIVSDLKDIVALEVFLVLHPVICEPAGVEGTVHLIAINDVVMAHWAVDLVGKVRPVAREYSRLGRLP